MATGPGPRQASVQSKTGQRFALPLTSAWLGHDQLDDLSHSRALLAELRRRQQGKTAAWDHERVQFFNHGDLPILQAHGLCNRGRLEDRQIPIKLLGCHQPRQLSGNSNSKVRRDRGTFYD